MRWPAARSWRIAYFTNLAGEPNATITVSASSRKPVSTRTSRSISGSLVAMYCALPSWPSAALAELADAERGDAPAAYRCPTSSRRRPSPSRAARGTSMGSIVERFLRMCEQVVAVDQRGVAPLVGEVERELHELDAFGDVLRCEHDVAVVAVTAAARRLVVVLLAARHVEHDERQLGERDLRERLLHEREALAGRAGRGARAGGQRAPRHADGFELRLGVDAHAADRRGAAWRSARAPR